MNKKIFQKSASIVFLVAVAVFCTYVVIDISSKDTTPPKIVFDSDTITVSVEDPSEELLKGVTAIDDKDGDVTDSLIIESISNMIDKGVCTVTYAAFDSSNCVAIAKRELVYSDYESPRFQLEKPMYVESWEISKIMESLTAVDCIEGDITNQIKIKKLISDNSSSVRNVEFQVTNNLGDTSYVNMEIEYKPNVLGTREVELVLSDYLVYIKKGTSFDPLDYVKAVTLGNKKYRFDGAFSSDEYDMYGINQEKVIELTNVEAISNVDTNQPGTYRVDYSFTQEEYYGSTKLIVIVE